MYYYLGLFLVCLLSSEAAYYKKYNRRHSYSVREATNDGGGGYHYPAPTASSSATGSGGPEQLMMPHEDLTSATFGGSSGSSNSAGSSGGSADAGYHYDAPASSAPQQSPIDFQSLSGVVESTLSSSGGSSGSLGDTSSSSLSAGGSSSIGGGGFNFGGFGSSNFGSAGISDGGRTSGSSDQFTGVQGELINEHPPSIFNYKPPFGGKDFNNLPHILPPGGKSIHELQEEADAKLRAIVAKAKMNQMEVVERISKLKTNYGYGTLGFDGFQDTRFKAKGNFDLGTHKAIDLGTSIDYNALKAADGKLKLPIQNVYHTKTLGIHIPQPYPVKHEVAVPHPFPVPHPVPVPQHHPTAYTPLSNEDVQHLTGGEGKGTPYGQSFNSFGGDFASSGGGNFGSGGGNFGSGGGFNFDSFGGSFNFAGNGGGSTFKGVNTGTYSIEPSQSISESSSVGGPEYGAGTPNAADGGQGFSAQDQGGQAVGMFGLPAGSTSGQLGSFDGSSAHSEQGHSVPIASSHVGSHEQSISSEAGAVSIPAMNFGERTRPRPEYGSPN